MVFLILLSMVFWTPCCHVQTLLFCYAFNMVWAWYNHALISRAWKQCIQSMCFVSGTFAREINWTCKQKLSDCALLFSWHGKKKKKKKRNIPNSFQNLSYENLKTSGCLKVWQGKWQSFPLQWYSSDNQWNQWYFKKVNF